MGDERAQWMLRVRNLIIYPSLQIVENASLQLRTVRPSAAVVMILVELEARGARREARGFRVLAVLAGPPAAMGLAGVIALGYPPRADSAALKCIAEKWTRAS